MIDSYCLLDQKIVKINEDSNEKKLENLEKSLSDDKKVLVIDNDETEITKITDFLNNKEYKVSSSVYARDCVEQVRSDIEYDLIIINDEMADLSALEVLKQLKEIPNFKTPVIVMIKEVKESIKKHYLNDGFTDCIIKSKLESELERITENKS